MIPMTLRLMFPPWRACGKLPPCDLSGVFLVEPLAILYHMMAKKGNGIEIYVLVKSTNGTTEDATWELIMSYSPNFQILIVQLKDKLFSKEGGLISHTSSDKLEEYETFRVKMYHNLNQLQWQLERENLYSRDLKTCLDVLRTPFKKFFDSKEQRRYIALDASLVTEGTTLDASLVTVGIAMGASLVDTQSTVDSNDDIRPSYDSDTVSELHHDIFENMFVHKIQNHEQPESIPDTYVVNENNRSIISDIPNMDPGRDKEEHDYVDHEQHRAFFASLVNNLKCDVENVIRLIVKLSKQMPY
ncbi:hypothetical protein Tco_1548060 [Tanacetum coccineum]